MTSVRREVPSMGDDMLSMGWYSQCGPQRPPPARQWRGPVEKYFTGLMSEALRRSINRIPLQTGWAFAIVNVIYQANSVIQLLRSSVRMVINKKQVKIKHCRFLIRQSLDEIEIHLSTSIEFAQKLPLADLTHTHSSALFSVIHSLKWWKRFERFISYFINTHPLRSLARSSPWGGRVSPPSPYLIFCQS